MTPRFAVTVRVGDLVEQARGVDRHAVEGAGLGLDPDHVEQLLHHRRQLEHPLDVAHQRALAQGQRAAVGVEVVVHGPGVGAQALRGEVEPLFEEGDVEAATNWCSGFVAGTRFESDAWSDRIDERPKWFTPILALTTESQQSKRDEAKKNGATGWLVKPVGGTELVKVIKQVLPGA